MPTYYVSNHVKSNNKLAWINCNYVATKYDKDLDKEFYDKINHVVVVSNFIKETLIHYPFYKKICVINDIVDPNLIIRLSNKVEDYKNELEINELKILTVARLEKIKGFDLLVNAAKSLKEKGVNFKWFIIGEGSERKMIESYCKKNELEDTVILLGMKINPYIYMKKCDIYVQTSKNEGLGLTVIEAKILEKIIICTNFSTASSLIEDKIDGRLCKINYEDIAEKIELVNNNNVLKNMIQNNLKNVQKFDTLDEIKKIYKLINED